MVGTYNVQARAGPRAVMVGSTWWEWGMMGERVREGDRKIRENMLAKKVLQGRGPQNYSPVKKLDLKFCVGEIALH
jgi:hypothetical protein